MKPHHRRSEHLGATLQLNLGGLKAQKTALGPIGGLLETQIGEIEGKIRAARKELINELEKNRRLLDGFAESNSVNNKSWKLREESAQLKNEVEALEDRFNSLKATHRHEIFGLREKEASFESYFRCQCDKSKVIRQILQQGSTGGLCVCGVILRPIVALCSSPQPQPRNLTINPHHFIHSPSHANSTDIGYSTSGSSSNASPSPANRNLPLEMRGRPGNFLQSESSSDTRLKRLSDVGVSVTKSRLSSFKRSLLHRPRFGQPGQTYLVRSGITRGRSFCKKLEIPSKLLSQENKRRLSTVGESEEGSLRSLSKVKIPWNTKKSDGENSGSQERSKSRKSIGRERLERKLTRGSYLSKLIINSNKSAYAFSFDQLEDPVPCTVLEINQQSFRPELSKQVSDLQSDMSSDIIVEIPTCKNTPNRTSVATKTNLIANRSEEFVVPTMLETYQKL